MTTLLQNFSIIHQLSCLHTLEQNRMTKCKHKHIVEQGFTLLAQASLPMTYSDYIFATAIYLINCFPTLMLNNTCPVEVLFILSQITLNYKCLV